MSLILASASPRRRDLLRQIGLDFEVLTAEIDETPRPGEQHLAYTIRLAEAKARAVLDDAIRARRPAPVVIGADTTVTIDGQLLGKPRDAGDAARMLRLLRGREHQVTTGVVVLTETRTLTTAETTGVTFAAMTDAEIAVYIGSGEPMDKAGAYGIQGRAACWIPRIVGDYSNVVGLPLAKLYAILKDASLLPEP